jgi:F-type H+-transporting ATPase subunit a
MRISSRFATLFVSLLSAASAFAGEAGAAHGEGPEGLPLYAEKIWKNIPITNSMIMTWVAVLLIILFSKIATHRIAIVPTGIQNFAEWLVESLYNFVESIVGPKLIKRTFWFFGGIFLFILINNLIGLMPGVGTIEYDGVPILRGGNADLNLTFAMPIVFTTLWFYWVVTEIGVAGLLKHIFAPKGEFKGFMKVLMTVIFLMVGVIEVFSILLRPVAFTFRLYGNVYAGENMLKKMMALVPVKYWYFTFAPALPFYFLELLVGLIQALVFMLLCAVFLKLMCDHDEEHDDEHAH